MVRYPNRFRRGQHASIATEFKPGERRSQATEFKPGEHWRPAQLWWDKEWLVREYVEKGRSASDIAKDLGCVDGNILYWLKKHGINRRTVSEARAKKHWGVIGIDNPMFGRSGAANPNYRGGTTPERQLVYASGEWHALIRFVFARDNYCCRRCGAAPRLIHAHHIMPWADHPDRRLDPDNLMTLCMPCHWWVHSRRNTTRLFLGGGEHQYGGQQHDAIVV